MASLEKVNEALAKLVQLIEPLKPLMKCHMVDYLTANHWETLLPKGIQQGLLNLPREKLYLMPSGALDLEDIGPRLAWILQNPCAAHDWYNVREEVA